MPHTYIVAKPNATHAHIVVKPQTWQDTYTVAKPNATHAHIVAKLNHRPGKNHIKEEQDKKLAIVKAHTIAHLYKYINFKKQRTCGCKSPRNCTPVCVCVCVFMCVFMCVYTGIKTT